MPLIFILIFITTAFAQELRVNYGLFNYQVEIKKNEVLLIGKKLKLSLNKHDNCKDDNFEIFRKKLLKAVHDFDIRKVSAPKKVRVNNGKVETFLSPESIQGRFFLSLPEKFKKEKIEQRILCKK